MEDKACQNHGNDESPDNDKEKRHGIDVENGGFWLCGRFTIAHNGLTGESIRSILLQQSPFHQNRDPQNPRSQTETVLRYS